MKVGLVRRGFSHSGGAERYLRRFAAALVAADHECVLFTSAEWPADQFTVGELIRVSGNSPARFADALEKRHPRDFCDLVFSLERVWRCDCYRAGDGVHAAWLDRLADYEPKWRSRWRRWRGKHRELLELERHLFSPTGARRVIANSHMVENEITARFDYPAQKIEVIYNGVAPIRTTAEMRAEKRRSLGISDEQQVVLFAGTGWQRKGLQFAIEAIKQTDAQLIVAGRGNEKKFPRSSQVRFVGPIEELSPFYAAADLFLLPTIYDPFSNACLEAMSAGLPVVTTSSNGFSETIRTGIEGEILSRADDLPMIAAAITRFKPLAHAGSLQLNSQKAWKYSMQANLRATLAVLEEQRRGKPGADSSLPKV